MHGQQDQDCGYYLGSASAAGCRVAELHSRSVLLPIDRIAGDTRKAAVVSAKECWSMRLVGKSVVLLFGHS